MFGRTYVSPTQKSLSQYKYKIMEHRTDFHLKHGSRRWKSMEEKKKWKNRWKVGGVSGGHTCFRVKWWLNGSGVTYGRFLVFICRNGERQKAMDGYGEDKSTDGWWRYDDVSWGKWKMIQYAWTAVWLFTWIFQICFCTHLKTFEHN